MKKLLFVWITVLMTGFALTAQSPQSKSFDQIFEEMQQQMLRGIPQKADTIQLKPGQKQYFQMSPDSSSYFYFHVDTTFGGGNGTMNPFFRFNPFGDEAEQGFGNFNDIFRQMEELQQQFFGSPSPGRVPLEAEPNDGLLPEEIIRQREAQPKNGEQPNVSAKPAKPKIKTTRI